MSKERNTHKQTKVGQVISTNMQKRIVVQVERRVPHPLYRRIVSKRKKFHAHDETGEARVGDRVTITECRPLSKTKSWKLTEVLHRAAQVDLSGSGE
jgi:small subunit ribosomal protein S17